MASEPDGDQIPALGDVVDYPDDQRDDERQWLVFYDEDYEDFIFDLDDNLGLMVDIDQAGEVIRLAAQALAALSHRDANGDDVIRDMIEALEKVQEADDGE